MTLAILLTILLTVMALPLLVGGLIVLVGLATRPDWVKRRRH